jgi:hypothetical protein
LIARALLGCLLLAPLAAAAQQNVYRCGQTYQQSPCERGGQAVEVDDSRSDAERKAARSVASDEAKLGNALQRERLAREKATRLIAAVGIGAPHTSEAASAPAKSKKGHKKKGAKAPNAGSADFTAIEPRARSDKSPKR